MKKSIKYVVVLCMLVVMAMPASAFAAEKTCYKTPVQVPFKISAEQIQNLCAKYMPNLKCNFDLQTMKNSLCTPAGAGNVTNTATKAPVMPVAPVAVPKPVTPVKAATPTAVEKPATPAQSGNAAGSYESQVVDLVNKERAAQGLAPLAYNAELSKVAEAKAADLRDKNYFSHTSPTYGSPFDMMKSFGIRYTAAGENIAKGYMSPSSVMDGWMNSPGHKANIMNTNFTEIGVGYVSGDNGTGYWVQMFIRP